MTDWIECDEEWAYWINPRTFRMPRVKERVPVGVVVVIKERTADGFVANQYALATPEGVAELDGKKAASVRLAEQMAEFMRQHGAWPANTRIKKELKNGKVDVSYDAGDYDTFTLRFNEELTGGPVVDFLGKLAPASSVSLGKQATTGEEPWRLEPARSSRARCRSCSEKIAKGELRLGEPSEFDGRVSYRWHHLNCARGRIGDVTALDGFSGLSGEQQQALLRQAAGGREETTPWG